MPGSTCSIRKIFSDPEHNERHIRIEELMWEIAVKVLKSGIDVILDFGSWTRSERDEL